MTQRPVRKDSPIVREARPEEAALVAELGRRTFTEAFGADNRPEDLAAFLAETYTPERQAAELADPAVTTFLAFADGLGGGEAAGFAQLRRGPTEPCVAGPRPIELQRIYVARAFHGGGVAQALLDACLDRARTEGFGTLWLGVWERNLRAQAFYRKWGFQDVGSHVFLVGRDPQTDRIFERPIAWSAS